MSAVPFRMTIACVLVALAAALTGCGRPEGLESVDVDAARETLVAQGRPDPLAPAGQLRFQVQPKAVKRRAVARIR
jgi:hypothetical protein